MLKNITILFFTTIAIILPAFKFSSPAKRSPRNTTNVIANNTKEPNYVETIVNNIPIPYGRVNAQGRIYNNGLLMSIIRVRGTDNWRLARGSLVIKGIDEHDQVLFVKKVNATTTCTRYDTCHSEVKNTKWFEIISKITPYIKRIDLQVREKNDSNKLFQ